MIPAAIRAGTILDTLPDRSGYVVALSADHPGVVCPYCPGRGAMALCIVRQRIGPDHRLIDEYHCLGEHESAA